MSNGGFKYIYPSKGDVMTPRLKRQIIEHNEFCKAQNNCGEPEFIKQ